MRFLPSRSDRPKSHWLGRARLTTHGLYAGVEICLPLPRGWFVSFFAKTARATFELEFWGGPRAWSYKPIKLGRAYPRDWF